MAQPPRLPARIPPAQPPTVVVPVVRPPIPTSPPQPAQPPASTATPTPHQPAPNPKERVRLVFVLVLVLVFLAGWYAMSSSWAAAQWEKDAKDTTQCLNEETDKWVTTPTGSYRGSKGKCIVGTPPATVVVVRNIGKVPTEHLFGADGCYEQDLGYEARWSPKDKAMRVHDPAGGSHVEALGTKSPISAFGPGRWRFCKEDPDATGVVIWE